MWLQESKLEAQFLVRDRDTKFSFAFDRLLFGAGIRRMRISLLAPDANAFAESWIGSFKRECLNHFLCFSLGHLDHIARAFVRLHNEFRLHQGLADRTIPATAAGPPSDDSTAVAPEDHRIRCEKFLSGLPRHYSRAAA